MSLSTLHVWVSILDIGFHQSMVGSTTGSLFENRSSYLALKYLLSFFSIFLAEILSLYGHLWVTMAQTSLGLSISFGHAFLYCPLVDTLLSPWFTYQPIQIWYIVPSLYLTWAIRTMNNSYFSHSYGQLVAKPRPKTRCTDFYTSVLCIMPECL